MLGIIQKNVKYRVKLVINKGGTPKIQAPKCDRQCYTCNSWCCCHLMALIWKLENMMKNSEQENSTPDKRCCPSKPRQWGKGKLKRGRIPPTFYGLKPCKTKPMTPTYPPGRREKYNHNFMIPEPPNFGMLMLMAFLN